MCGIKEKLNLAERMNKILFIKSKHRETQITKLQSLLKSKLRESRTNNISVDETGDNEKILITHLEQINNKIKELEEKTNKKYILDDNSSDLNERIPMLQSRIQELSKDIKRYCEKYKTARKELLRFLLGLAKDKRRGIKNNREITAKINVIQKNNQNEDTERSKIYSDRLLEVK